MKTLIIVDCQNDFILDNAPLKVEGAKKACDNIIKLLKNNKIDNVIFTLDWHPVQHCSFKENGGIWNKHCIHYTEGAAIYNPLIQTCIKLNINWDVHKKGLLTSPEEYGAFNVVEDMITYYDLCSETDITYLSKKNQDIIICGIAGDYCVLETLKQIRHLNPKVYLDGIVSIDGGEKLNQYIKENNIKLYD